MEKQTFYRVGREDHSGMWYDQQGNYLGLIHSPEFKHLTCHNVPMPYDTSIVGWLSATKTLEELKHWFSDADMEILEPLGYNILKYEATEYMLHNNHWVINQNTSKLLTTPQLKDK